ncbi:hypothetical protein F4778DRAFT_201693 [Xylariomycetidae sp. FL2044]|nr:hypothetical protein F4778DRAFT_201693 [Xylariomycetidae sp. FL2044]
MDLYMNYAGFCHRPEQQSYLCRKTAQEPKSQKRSREEESTADLQPAKKHKPADETSAHDAEIEIPAEKLIEIMSHADLQELCRNLLTNDVTGSLVRQELETYNQRALEHSRSLARAEYSAIVKSAAEATGQLEDEAMEEEGLYSSGDWSSALCSFLPRVDALHNRGMMAKGPEFAAKALMGLADLCIYDWTGSEAKIYDGEYACQDFHEAIDDRMLVVCQTMKGAGEFDWLRHPDRKEKLWKLQEAAENYLPDVDRCTHRYQRTLQFLEQF